jgi:hypothetical protein
MGRKKGSDRAFLPRPGGFRANALIQRSQEMLRPPRGNVLQIIKSHLALSYRLFEAFIGGLRGMIAHSTQLTQSGSAALIWNEHE